MKKSTINGVLNASGSSTAGTPPYYARNGSGGSVFISCLAFAGTNGVVIANAGLTGHQSFGGGERVARPV